jgi:hypothetical protein
MPPGCLFAKVDLTGIPIADAFPGRQVRRDICDWARRAMRRKNLGAGQRARCARQRMRVAKPAGEALSRASGG